jgi:hypothetical protein
MSGTTINVEDTSGSVVVGAGSTVEPVVSLVAGVTASSSSRSTNPMPTAMTAAAATAASHTRREG